LKARVVGDCYHIDCLSTGAVTKLTVPGLREDGHCAAVYGTNFFVTDTYVDPAGTASLYVVDHAKQEVTDRLIFHGLDTLDFEYRCDLHPRIFEGRYLCIDLASGGLRRIEIYGIA